MWKSWCIYKSNILKASFKTDLANYSKCIKACKRNVHSNNVNHATQQTLDVWGAVRQ